LFDLIKPKDPRFAPAFFKGIANTLVADNLEQANRIAYGQRRWRVVTLAGQLIDSSGTMSGGGTQVSKGGMSSKLAAEAVHPEVLKVLERDSENDARLLDEAVQELQRLETALDGLTRSGPQTDIALEKATLDIQNGKKRIAEAEKRVRELK
jgi:structural maintenance of chromosome 4